MDLNSLHTPQPVGSFLLVVFRYANGKRPNFGLDSYDIAAFLAVILWEAQLKGYTQG